MPHMVFVAETQFCQVKAVTDNTNKRWQNTREAGSVFRFAIPFIMLYRKIKE